MNLAPISPRPITPKSLSPRPISTIIHSEQDIIFKPEVFARSILAVTTWDIQEKILQALATKPRIAVKACHASSKTFTAAVAVLWFLARHTDEAVVVTTAPTWAQVEKLLWGEVHSALTRSKIAFPKANLTELKLGPKRYAYGISTIVTKKDEGVRFQGIHAKNVLVILDEAPGVDAKIWEAVEGARAGGNVRVLALGNPTIASGPFHTAFTDHRTGWTCFTIDGFNTPNMRGVSLEQLLQMEDDDLDDNVCPYLITRRWIKEKYYEWGPGHPSWESRVRGAFPKQAPDALLSLDWIEQAALRTIATTDNDEWTAGIDVAGPGEDETSLTIRRGPSVILHVQTTEADPRGWALMHLRPYKDRLSTVNIDCIGVGWNFYQHINDHGYTCVPVNVCERANDPEKFADLKTEFFWGLRQRFQQNDIAGLTDEKTIGQLAGIRYEPTPRGQIKVESKQDAIKRGVKSPDRAESVMLAYASRMLVYGALEYFKKQQQDVVAKAGQVKELGETHCPKCTASCIVPSNNGYRCNQCGHQWSTKPLREATYISRSKYLNGDYNSKN